jgi:hypothetical protein
MTRPTKDAQGRTPAARVRALRCAREPRPGMERLRALWPNRHLHHSVALVCEEVVRFDALVEPERMRHQVLEWKPLRAYDARRLRFESSARATS